MSKSCAMPPDFGEIRPWKQYLKWFLRIILIIGAVAAILVGEVFFGVLAFIALAIITWPQYVTANRVCHIPVEIEILFLLVVFLELILADANSFYTRFDYYDKFMHILVPAVLGLIGMMIIYTFYALGRLQASLGVMFAIIVMVVMGTGAALEMSEYFYDQILYPVVGEWLPTGFTQGSNLAPPLNDTMQDLWYDLFGALLGALLGVWLIKRAEREGKEPTIVEELEAEIEFAAANSDEET
ncbi:hypothetical protein FGU46_07330 [Methanobacterium sp. CWC-01]|uniref:hypothetical protein n=1 Tax=Methanobacterium aridiramus TaxID=2584467 RepID=UPI002578E5D5|nr:hypothetical protein [Methanobacterium sp. CWC-01]WJI09911.1 hypothetical protein FGU46_07330 [Methanobacterium sp. CWC-01]